MKVFKYIEFLLEGNTPENYISQCMDKMKIRLNQAFNPEEDTSHVKKMSDFSKFNLQLEGEITIHDATYSRKNLTCKFSDDEGRLYILNIAMNVEDAVNPNKDQDYKTSDIKKAHVTFKKYSDKEGSLDIEDQLLDRTVDPESVDGDFLIKLKVDLDKGKDPGEEEEFQIETEEKPEEENEAQPAPAAPAQGQAAPPAQGQVAPPAQAKNTPQETV